MNQRANFLTLCLLDALEDEEEKVVYDILDKYQVDPCFIQRERGIAPLHYSCGMPNDKLAVEITRRFLEREGNVNVRTSDNMTALHVAAMYGRADIVKMLLERGAEWDVVDDERKTPVLYAIEECHFDVVQIMRDYIFEDKFESKKKRHNNSIQNRVGVAASIVSMEKPIASPIRSHLNKNILSNAVDEQNKYTPNKIHYNYDVTSPYYINITHRRHKQQPKFPVEELCSDYIENNQSQKNEKSSASAETISETVNIFTLSKENLQELSKRTSLAESSRISLIESWREKVQRSRDRASILKEYDNIDEMIDSMMQNDHLNFSNTRLRGSKEKLNSLESDSARGSDSRKSTNSTEGEDTQYAELPQSISPQPQLTNIKNCNHKSLGQLIQSMANAQIDNPEPDIVPESDTSYRTVPEILGDVGTVKNSNLLSVHDADTSNFIRSPKHDEYILQMTEAYVHTDNENGLVFYETKLVRNAGNKMAVQRTTPAKRNAENQDTSITSKSTNFTLPIDYETDALRAELTNFGEPPGPITKSTKRLYIKRLVKYKRQNSAMMEIRKKNDSSELEFSVELYRTVRSPQFFKQIPELMRYETESSKYFANNKQKKEMREGHLKQSFIYLLIDPRISCNLPGESEFSEKYLLWRRFLHSIFYVGKGKTSRPYSHLYDAMKIHTRINAQLVNPNNVDVEKLTGCAKKLCTKPAQTSSDSKKLNRILDIWNSGHGVVCLHVFHNIVPSDAYTREAAIIESLSLQHLTNIKRGNFYGPAKSWTMKEKKYLGIALLFKAMQIFMAEGESQLSPSDLI